jgi:gliding motility-associated-like protein
MINDFFSVVGGNLKEIQMQIYNRWGEKLYDTSSKNPKWDGTYKGELCEQGVYLYMLTLKTWNGKIHFFKGTLTLIR